MIFLFSLLIWYELKSSTHYLPGIYNLDYDRVKKLDNRLYIQRKEFRENYDKLYTLRTTVKYLIRDNKNLTSLKYLCEYEVVIK